MEDIVTVAEKYTIKNVRSVVQEVLDTIPKWSQFAQDAGIPKSIINSIQKNFFIPTLTRR